MNRILKIRLRLVAMCLASLAVAFVALAVIAWFHPPLPTWLYVNLLGLSRPVPPVRVADHVYYVGSSDLAAFLVTGDQGHVVIDSGSVQTEPQILANIRTLGFNPKDVKVILNSHGHFDHAAGIAALKAATGARFYASPEEAKLIESGGRDDFVFGDHMAYPPAKVDHVLADGEVVRVGKISLSAHFTPGHTKGCTSWTMSVTVGSKPHNMLLICSVSILGALKGNTAYPGIADDFRKSFARLEGLPCEVFLAPHASMFRLQSKRESGKADAFVDPAGCEAFLKKQKQAFEEALAREN